MTKITQKNQGFRRGGKIAASFVLTLVLLIYNIDP